MITQRCDSELGGWRRGRGARRAADRFSDNLQPQAILSRRHLFERDGATYQLLLQDPLFLPAGIRTNKGPASSQLLRPSQLTDRDKHGPTSATDSEHYFVSASEPTWASGTRSDARWSLNSEEHFQQLQTYCLNAVGQNNMCTFCNTLHCSFPAIPTPQSQSPHKFRPTAMKTSLSRQALIAEKYIVFINNFCSINF